METKLLNTMETFNECTIMVLLYLIQCFTGFVPSSDTRSDLGLVYISVNLGSILLHFIIMLVNSLKWAINRLRLKYRRSQAIKAAKARS